MWHWSACVQPLLQLKSSMYYVFWVCICSLRYAACNGQSTYCHLWPLRLYNIFQPYLINGNIFEKTNIERKMCVLTFCTTFTWIISLSEKFWARYDQKRISVFVYSLCPILMKLELYRQFFLKNSNIKFHEKPSSERWIVACGPTGWQTDTHDEANSRFSLFCERT